MRACEKIVEVLIESGIRYVFGLPGGGMMNIFDALFDRQDAITAIQARDEQTASCMACMYGRLTGMPGVFVAQGPFAGSTGMFGVMEAHLSSSPMLVLYQTQMPGTYFAPGGIGGVSWSLPAVFVAKLLNPDRPCVAVCSDGGFSMQMHILLTARQYNVPAVFVVMNNGGFGMIRENLGARSLCTDFIDTDYSSIANACGCLGLRVEKPSDLRPAMAAALKSEKPSVVDVVIEKNAKMFEKLYSPLAKEARKRLRVRMIT
jgi:thiamine pyrophosphate-dependent acetolactate synthase large subunit-like protein